MEANKILTADLLDIIFEDKNKNYGAYELRKSYNGRLNKALGITAFIIMIFTSSFMIGNNSHKVGSMTINDNHTILPPPDDKIPPPPKPILPPPPVQIKTIAFTPPLIIKDIDVLKPPPENADLDKVAIDVKSKPGEITDAVRPPVEETNTQVFETPRTKATGEDSILFTVEIDARFTGDWNSYVKKEIEKHIDELTESGESGTCIVKFVVSKEGEVSNVEATTMKGTKLAEIAVNAIRKGPKWNAAMQNGRKVTAYRMQPITFTIQEQ